MCIPWLGYLIGYVVARLCRQPHEDAIAICIEIGNQNTGIAIFLLRYALQQPAADITTGKIFLLISLLILQVTLYFIFINYELSFNPSLQRNIFGIILQ